MTAQIIDGNAMAAAVRDEVKAEAVALKAAHGLTPGLAVVLVGENPASVSYVRGKEKDGIEVGFFAATIRHPADITQDELMGLVRELNQDARFHGILVQLPLPPHIDAEQVIESLDPAKDVDGLHSTNAGLLLKGGGRLVPCTPLGVQQMLLRSGHPPEGKHVVICGRSNLVGKPLGALLVQKQPGANATVTLCHTGTRDLARHTLQADILVAATGSARGITAAMVREGAVVIDVGINRVADASTKSGFRLVGDVDYGPVAEKAAAITPVPGGVGPMTRAMLLVNTLRAARAQARVG
ncbi:MAG: bifunctional 5,10-methylene-tetrahydrofolate dehydrogenase/5,10-methylene-tetrahydrofolate cyclohydrolase [Dehalococcoidia bacterium]|nr:bifunctional 5,10-methylene-tetrahydrofolate dehydrogenase/5,10-methylene-tetrahydrofolate cyclohydrolase [Dehalococcoidia bacterium]